MIILSPKDFPDYQLLDSGEGERLEKFGEYILRRPDPQCIWKKKLSNVEWNKVDAFFDKNWEIRNKKLPRQWQMSYGDVNFLVRLSPFKHTGVFPEQAVQWDFISSVILNSFQDPKMPKQVRHDIPPHILNLFAYTGIASVVAAKAGAKVTHLDASFPTIGWAKENQKTSRLKEDTIRWILDDAIKFVTREIKRGVKYDGIIMDPPIYGHGPEGEKWDFNKDFPILVDLCSKILSDNPLFVIVNAYAISSSSIMLENVLKDYLPEGTIESGELVLEDQSGRLLSTGIFARWAHKE